VSFKINTAVTGFTFGLVALADGTAVTTGTTTGFVTLDNGTQAAIAGLFTHKGNGQWSVNLTAAEMNGAIVGLVFVNTLAINVNFTIRTVIQLNSEQNDFDPAADPVANVTLVATTTTNTDMRGTDSAQLAANAVVLPSIPVNWITSAGINAAAMNGKGDWNIGKTGYTLIQSFPTNFASMNISGAGAVDSLVQGYLNTVMTEVTAGRIAGNFGVFYRNADALTTNVVDNVGAGGGGGTDWTASERNEIRGRLGVTGTVAAGGNTPTLSLEATLTSMQGATFNTLTDSLEAIRDRGDAAWITATGGGSGDWTVAEREEIRGRLGITGTTAAGGNTPTLSLQTTVDAVKADTAAILTDTADMQPKLGAPSTTISGDIATRMAEASINTTAGAVDNVTLVATTTTNTDMRGTDGVTSAPTAIQNRQEMDANSVDLNQIVSDVAGLAGAAMRGTDGANIVVPDPAGTANTLAPDNATIALIRTDTLTTIPALLNDIAITKNQAGVFHVDMVKYDAVGIPVPVTGATVTGQRMLDSGVFVNVTGTFTEISNGQYRYDYTAADCNGDTVTWKFSAVTADDTKMTFLTVT